MRKLFSVLLLFLLLSGKALAIESPIPTTTYDAFGTMVRMPNGSLLLVYKQATSHTGQGTMRKYVSSDEGETWTGPTTLFTPTGANTYGEGSLGVIGNRIVLCFNKFDGVSTISSLCTYSDDNSSTWATPVALSGAVYTIGEIRPGCSGLIIGAYDAAAGANNVYLYKTTDGISWDSGTNVINSATILYSESAYEYLGDGQTIIGLVRADSNDTAGLHLTQVKSADCGATWASQGTTTFDSWSFNVSTLPQLRRYGDTVRTYYHNRDTGKIRKTSASVTAIKLSSTAWSSPTDLATTQLTGPGTGGYTSTVLLTSGTNVGKTLVYYYDEYSAGVAKSTFVLDTFTAGALINNGATITAGAGVTITAGTVP